jgi:uncharacterized spore protein YtfJ
VSVRDILGYAADAAQVRRVFGEPIEQDGVVVLPAAVVRAGAGGGGGQRPEKEGGEGLGGGYGFTARPAGAFVIRDGEVEWRPAIDATAVVLGGQLVAVIGLLVARSVLRRRRR